MVEYNARIDWQISHDAKKELVRRFVDITKLRVSCTKGIIEISGDLAFSLKSKEDTEVQVLVAKLKSIDSTLRAITYVRDVQWRLESWKKSGQRWAPSKEMEKKLTEKNKQE